MAVLVSDSFNRADSTTTLGSTDSYNGGTSQAWSFYSGGVWGISTNQAYTPTVHIDAVSYVDVTPQTDNVKVSLTIANSNVYINGIAFRIQDANNFFRAYVTGTTLKIDRKTAGTWSNIYSVAITGTTVTFPLPVSVSVSGSTITAYVNGVQQGSVTDTNFQTASCHGLYINNNSTIKEDNFFIESTATGTTYTGGGTSAGVGSVSDTNTFISATTTYPGGGASTGSANTSDTNHLILAGSGTSAGVGSASDTNTMQVPTIYSGGGVSSGLASLSDHCIMVMVAGGNATGVADAEFFEFSFSPPPECMITSQILNYTQSFPVLIQDAVGATTTIINVTPDANGHFQIVLPMEEVRVMVLINGKLYLDRYIWALDGESRLPIINYR